jgi:hypothetical protein
MASGIRSTFFRVTGFHNNQAESDIRSKINYLMTEDERQRVVAISCIPSCDGSQTTNALVEFRGGNPKFLSHLDHDPLGDWQVEIGDEDINFDRHFFGFTQLYPTAPGVAVAAEYDLY